MIDKNKQKLIERNHLKRKNGGWDCKYCSCNFVTRQLLYEHISDVHKDKTRSNYKNRNRIWECKYCLDVFSSRRKLFEHYKICEKRKNLPKDSLGRIIGDYDRKAAGKKSLESRRKNGTLGHPCSDEQRARIAEAMRKYRARLGILHKANVSEKACKYIDELNIQKGWELQHGLNGGEK